MAAVDDLFDTYFDDPFAAPSLEQAVAPTPAPSQHRKRTRAPEPSRSRAAVAPEPALGPQPNRHPNSTPNRASNRRAEPEAAPEPVLATEPVFTDELDPDLLPVFMEEAADLLPQIGKDLRQWQQTRPQRASRTACCAPCIR